eukprot:1059986-Prorocentrum_minimum.AAC.1
MRRTRPPPDGSKCVQNFSLDTYVKHIFAFCYYSAHDTDMKRVVASHSTSRLVHWRARFENGSKCLRMGGCGCLRGWILGQGGGGQGARQRG